MAAAANEAVTAAAGAPMSPAVSEAVAAAVNEALFPPAGGRIATSANVPLSLAEVRRDLEAHPGLFDFFQAVRLMLRIRDRSEGVGQFANPGREALRFLVNSNLSFPPSAIRSLEWKEPLPLMTVNFMGLTGPQGVLPYWYSELIQERLRNKDRTLAAFLDIFNHRMISLFYLAWEKYRAWVAYERDGEDRLSRYLMSLIGIGTAGLQRRLEVADEALLFYTGLVSLQPRSAVALEQLLGDYFGVPVEVEQFVGAWQPLSLTDLCVFDEGVSLSEQLGVGAVVGDEIWDQQSRARVKLGPLSSERYLSFLPGGDAIDRLRDLTKLFCGEYLEVEIQLILQRDEVPRCDLGKDDLAGPRLGWYTWVKSGPDFNRSPADTVMRLA